MPSVSQMLKTWANKHGNPPLWIVEKDYALSYLLAGIAQVGTLHRGLVLKGGTALKKMYLKDYRFSEDLDFSLVPGISIPDIEEAMREAVLKNDCCKNAGRFWYK